MLNLFAENIISENVMLVFGSVIHFLIYKIALLLILFKY